MILNIINVFSIQGRTKKMIEILSCEPLSEKQLEIIKEAIEIEIAEPIFYFATPEHIQQLKEENISGISRKQRK